MKVNRLKIIPNRDLKPEDAMLYNGDNLEEVKAFIKEDGNKFEDSFKMWGDKLIHDFEGDMRMMKLVHHNSFIIRNLGGNRYYTNENDGYFKIING